MRVIIANESDRITVAGILIKNGYRVKAGREQVGPRKRYTYFLELDMERADNNATEREFD